jgi:predicted Zn-dependent protease
MLEQALSQSPDAPAPWKAAAQAQLVIALAGQANRHDEVPAMLRTIGADSPAQILAVLHGLSLSAQRSRSEDRPRIAKLQLLAAALLAPARSQLTPEDQQTLDRAGAEALAAADRRDEALDAYKSLAAAHPDSGAIRQGYAELLLAGDDKASLEAALAQWRIIASRSRPRTDRWYQAKYSIAQAQFKLGDKAGAATLLRYTLETPPGLADTGWEQRFQELLKESGQVGDLPH